MNETSETRTIAANPDEIWAELSDFAGIAKWAPNVDHSSLTTEQTEGVGASRRVQVGRTVLLETVSAWDPGHELSYTIEGLPPIVRSLTNTWTISGTSGATTVTLTTRIDTGPRPPQQLVGRIVARITGRTSRQMISGLQSHIEQTDRSEPAEGSTT